jgi:hypothetical protein
MMIHPLLVLMLKNEEVIDTSTERLAPLSQNDIDAFLESFESDDDDFRSEEEDEVGAVDDASHYRR